MRLFVIAGEPSGDLLGGALLSGLRALVPDLEVLGVGGPAMQGHGLSSIFPMSDLSVMGLAEIVPRYPLLRRRLREASAAVLAARPDALITIDSPDFGLRVARRVKAASVIRTVHYVAPTVWAWRPGRAAKMAQVIDQVLALFPFEPPYMEAAGMRCDFVGHPVVAAPQASPAECAAFRAGLGLGAAPLLLVLPGSRAGEVARLGPRFGAAVAQVAARRPDLRVVVPAAGPETGPVAQAVAHMVQGWAGAPVVLHPGQPDGAALKRAAFGAADVALAASGTVSLELAAAGTPMVIGYDMAPLTRAVLSRLLRINTVTLVNIVSQTSAVPEFLGKACQPAGLAGALCDLLENPQARAAQHAAAALTMERLGKGGEAPGLRAARAVLDGMMYTA